MRSPLVDQMQDPVTGPGGRRAGSALCAGLAAVAVAALAAAPPAHAGSRAMALANAADIAIVAALEGAPPPPGPKPVEAGAATADAATADGTTAAASEDPAPRTATTTMRPQDADAVAAAAALIAPPGPADAAQADGAADGDTAGPAPPERDEPPIALEARVDSGDTLIGLLIEAGVDRLEAHKAVKALEPVYDPRAMRPGHVVKIRFEPGPGHDEDLSFAGFDFAPDPATQVAVLPDTAATYGFSAEEMKADLTREVVRYGGPITLSLYQSAVEAGVSEHALADMIHILSYDIDFQRDIKRDDVFEIMYERYKTTDGRPVRDGRVLFAALTNGGKRIVAYAFETEDGTLDYFDEEGQGVRKPLMRTPIDGARLSSSYGMRRHPILGYSKMHTGVDFAAPTGTPIYAAGDGVVRFAGRKGGYGKYVQIRHTGEFSTAYAHMSRILVRHGARVEQGEIIGRVGSTGRSTGPHLHYEIIRNGKKVNPMGVRFQPAVTLAGAELERFQGERRRLDTLYASLRMPTEIASAAPPASTGDDTR